LLVLAGIVLGSCWFSWLESTATKCKNSKTIPRLSTIARYQPRGLRKQWERWPVVESFRYDWKRERV
jgi:hypothetical protein